MTNKIENTSGLKIWIIIVSFILPIIGPIAYFIYRRNNIKTARFSLLASLIGLTIVIINRYAK